MHLKSSFWNMIRLFGCTIINFLPLNTIKGNSMDVAVDNIFSNHLKLMLWNYKKTSVYDHPTDSSNVTF